MLLKLPVELIERVVRFTTPDEITSKTYQQRQDALLSLCLVNSLLLDIARPVLEENWLVKDEIWWWNRLRDHSQSRAPQRLRFLWILASKETLQWIEVEWALELRPNLLEAVRDLRLCEVQCLDIEFLAAMPRTSSSFPRCSVLRLSFSRLFHQNLRLCLSSVEVYKEDVSYVFDRITELTCDTVWMSGDAIANFLSLTTFPLLQHLAFRQSRLSATDGSEQCAPTPDLLRQLPLFVHVDPSQEAPFFSHVDCTSPPLPNTPFAVFSLTGVIVNLELIPAFTHVRIRVADKESLEEDAKDAVESLICGIQGLWEEGIEHLMRLSLPEALKPYATELVSVARTHEVELVFEDEDDERGGSFLPRSTLDYAEKFRAWWQRVCQGEDPGPLDGTRAE